MKKVGAILFVAILLFNGFGYRILNNYFDQKATDHLAFIIEQNAYNAIDLISIKSPINLPYYSNNPIFEKVQGEIVINGMIYQYVERRIYNDSLEIKILPNDDRLHIKNAREDFYKLALDLEQTGLNKNAIPVNKSTTKVVSIDYFSPITIWEFNKFIPLEMVFGHHYQVGLLSIFLPIHTPPPKMEA